MKQDKQEGPDIGAFLLAPVLHFYSGRPLQNLSGVDTVERVNFPASKNGPADRSNPPGRNNERHKHAHGSLFVILVMVTPPSNRAGDRPAFFFRVRPSSFSGRARR